MKRLSIAAGLLLLGGCTTGDKQAPASVGMANPASVYCAEQGGKLSIENQPAGQVGICTLPDGTQMEEWALYRRDHTQK